ncbi:VOC family protein [bacterium]|nr:VOC family protein [bacterium]
MGPFQKAQTTTSLAVGSVALTVHDLERVSDYYQREIGLHLLRSDGDSAALGAGDRTLLVLRRDPHARRRSPREAGLFHTAFLLPTRASLAQWLLHAIGSRVAVDGASDHAVSEAIYLSDPEGNGIEIYADRPRAEWKWSDGMVHMSTMALDLEDLVSSAEGGKWTGFPDGAIVGHVHLQVGDLSRAEPFYRDTLGLEVTCRYPGALFYAADGYHHHLATNIWNSRGAAIRSFPSTGLAEVGIRVDPGRAEGIRRIAGVDGASPVRLRDPWGTSIAVSIKA